MKKMIFMTLLLGVSATVFCQQAFRDTVTTRTRAGYQLILKKNGYGLMDISGEVIIDGFDMAEPVSDGFSKVTLDRKNFLLSTNGTFLKDASGNKYFPGVRSFSDGLAAYDSGYIVTTGAKVIATTATHTDFMQGWAAIHENKKWYIIDKSGSRRDSINFDYADAQFMNLGYGYFLTGDLKNPGGDKKIYNTRGEKVTPSESLKYLLENAQNCKPFKNGVAYFEFRNSQQNRAFNLVDTALNTLVPYGFDYYERYHKMGIAGNGNDAVWCTTMDGKKITIDERNAMLTGPPKIKAMAVPNLPLAYLGQGIYNVTLVEDRYVGNQSVVVDSTGRLLIKLGRVEGQDGFIWKVEEFVDGFAVIQTSSSKVPTEEEIAKRRAEWDKMTEDMERKRTEIINAYKLGDECPACHGTGTIDKTPVIEIVNDFGRVLGTTSSKIKTVGVCSRCQGKGRIKKK